MIIKLKECPFCDGKATVESFIYKSTGGWASGFVAKVKCENCHASIDHSRELIARKNKECIEGNLGRVNDLAISALCLAKKNWNRRCQVDIWKCNICDKFVSFDNTIMIGQDKESWICSECREKVQPEHCEGCGYDSGNIELERHPQLGDWLCPYCMCDHECSALSKSIAAMLNEHEMRIKRMVQDGL